MKYDDTIATAVATTLALSSPLAKSGRNSRRLKTTVLTTTFRPPMMPNLTTSGPIARRRWGRTWSRRTDLPYVSGL
jgi:hypothetical protein